MLTHREKTIEAWRGPAFGINRIYKLVEEVTAASGKQGLFGVGIGATGPVDPQRGVIDNPHTLPTWENVPIVDELSKRLNVPVILENDADVAALGEYWVGAGREFSRLYMITVGTGIGTALIYDGVIYRGLDGAHPEGGHQIIDPSGPKCYCGAHGCWESLASGTAIGRFAQDAVLRGESSIMLEMVGDDVQSIDARITAEAARRGDPLAKRVIEQAAYYFSLGLINIITLFVPDVIVLSGGVMKSMDLFTPHIQNALREHNVMVPVTRIKVIPAALGYYAGMYGAAYAIVQIVE
jgi:glucokinase